MAVVGLPAAAAEEELEEQKGLDAAGADADDDQCVSHRWPINSFAVVSFLIAGALCAWIQGQQDRWQVLTAVEHRSPAGWHAALSLGALLVALPLALLLATPTGRTAFQDAWRPLKARLAVVAICAVFMVAGPALIVLNKDIMQKLGFPYPLTLSSWGLGCAALLVRVGHAAGVVVISEDAFEMTRGWKWVKVALPISLAKALTLASGNAVYLFLGVGFIQMLKAGTPAIIVVLMKCLGVKSPSPLALACVALLIVGGLFEVKGELRPSAIGLLLMLGSEFCEALNLVLTQKLLQHRQFSVVEGLYLIAPASFLLLSALAAALEWPHLVATGAWRIALARPAYFLGAAFAGVVVNLVGLMVVQATSSLMLKLLATVRNAGVVLVGVLLYREVVTPVAGLGYAISMLGFLGYNALQLFPEQTEALERRCGRCRGGDARTVAEV